MSYERPEQLEGTLTKIKMPCGSFYIIVGTDNKGYPREVFGEGSKHGTCRAWIECGSRLATKLLQEGMWDEVMDALRGIRCPACERTKGKLIGTGQKDEMVHHPQSCGDAVAKEIEKKLENRKEKK